MRFFNRKPDIFGGPVGRLEHRFWKSVQPGQLMAFIAAVIYCLGIIFDAFVIEFPLAFFEAVIVLVGLGYMLGAPRSLHKTQLLIIGALWIGVGISTVLSPVYKWHGIPVVVIISTIGYILTMAMMAYDAARRRDAFGSDAAYICCISYTVLMTLVHIFSLVGFVAYLKPYRLGTMLSAVGQMVLSASQISLLEFLSMLAVILTLLLKRY